MNYITEIKAFYDLVQVKQLSQGQIALWHALMHINNKCSWIEWFSVPNIMLELHTGLSRSGIAKARNVLKQYGLIDFKPNGTKATNYKMMPMSKSEQASNQVSKQDGNQVSKQVSNQVGGTLNKLNKTKLNKTVEEKKEEPTAAADEVVVFYLNNINPMITPSEAQDLVYYEKQLPKELLLFGMQKAVDQKARKMGYIKSIWNSWLSKGITTLAEAKEEKKEAKVIKLDWKGVQDDDFFGV